MLGRRLRLIAIMLAVIVSTVTACSSQQGETTADGKTVLSFANWQWLEPGRGERLWEAMKAYEKVNPQVTFRKESATRADYEKTIQTQMGAGKGPDLLIVPQALFQQLGAANLLVPLEDVAPDPHQQMETYRDKRLVYTWEVVNFAFFWNKKLLAESGVKPPTSMDQLEVNAKKIKSKTGKPGFAFRHATSELQPWWSDFGNFIYGYGGSWAQGGKLTIDNPKNVEAVTAFKKLYDSGAMPVGDDASTFRSRFAHGEIGMMFDNASVLFTILDGNKSLDPDDIGVAELPMPTDNSSQVTNFIGISKHSKNSDAAMGFLTWLSSDAGQKASAEGIFPSLNATAAQPSASVADKYPWISVYRDQSKTAEGTPVIPGFEQKTPQIATVVMKAVEGCLVDDQDPAEALAAAQREAEAI